AVTGGQPSTGTVTLSAAAPAGGILVNLSSNNANATVPASLVIPQGQTTGQFTVTTTTVASQQTAQINAASANTVNAALTINAPTAGQGQIACLALAPTAVTGGEPSTGKVTLSAAAPAGGILVNLSSNNANATVPGSLVIPQGQTTGQFTVTTTTVASQQTAQITAASANTVNATLTINAPTAGQGQIAGLALAPTAVSGGQPSTGTVTLTSPAQPGGVLVQLSSGSQEATTPASITIAEGQTSGQFLVVTLPVVSQKTAQITATSANSTSATLTIKATPAGQGQIAGLSLSPTTVNGGESSTGTVTLSAAAPVGGVLVNLSSGNLNATVLPSLVIPGGQSSAQFQVTTVTVGAQQTAQISASSANTVSASLTINPNAHCVSSLVLNVEITDLLSGAGVLHATATLDGPAPAGGSQISLVRSGASIGTINVPQGQTSGSVNIAIANLLTIVGSTVEALLNGCPAVQATIALGSPVTGAIAGVSLNPSTVFAGQPVTGTVTLVSPAGSNGVLVSLSTNNPSATILASSVVVPAGQTSTTFPVNTVNTSSSTIVVAITAASGASSKSANLTIHSSNPCVEGLQLTANITNLASGTGVLNALVTLSGPAPAGGANVPLLIGSSQIGQVAIPANQSTGSTSITLANLPTLIGSVVRAVFGPCGSINATIAVNAPILGSLTVPASITLGQSATGSVILNSPAPAGGATIQLAKTPLGLVGDLLNALLGAVVIPSSVTVPEGQTQATFSINTSVIGGLLGALLPSSSNLQIDAVLQSAFASSADSKVMQCNK
ncbi:MAG: hypothetical protein KDC27_21955, partial [Acidobacteria bacterium]|nr:hypothetical protein [Acidobacteriota bacterium]